MLSARLVSVFHVITSPFLGDAMGVVSGSVEWGERVTVSLLTGKGFVVLSETDCAKPPTAAKNSAASRNRCLICGDFASNVNMYDVSDCGCKIKNKRQIIRRLWSESCAFIVVADAGFGLKNVYYGIVYG